MPELKSLIISIIRTVVMPLVAGGVLQLILLANADPSAEVRAAAASLLAMIWYLVARLLESRNRYWGIMLLVAVQPNYETYDPSSDLVLSVQRTLVPLVVGWGITALARYGFDIDEGTLTLALQAGITSIYYGAIRIIEQYRPRAGALIGGRYAEPVY